VVFFLPAVIVIFALPFFIAVILPALSTSRIFGLLLLNVTFRFVAFVGEVFTLSNAALPIFSDLGGFVSVSFFKGAAFLTTVTLIVRFLPFSVVAVMVAFPGFFGVILPVDEFTAAIFGLLLFHVSLAVASVFFVTGFTLYAHTGGVRGLPLFK
jgi:hypothetical protein